MDRDFLKWISEERLEVWRPVPTLGFEVYASSEGRIFRPSFISKNKKNWKGKFPMQNEDRDGYLLIGMNYSTYKVHRLVCLAFFGISEKPQVNHLNRIVNYNKAYNLEWATSQEDADHCHSKWHEIVTPEGKLIRVFNLARFCRENNLIVSCVVDMIKNPNTKRKQHKGFTKP